jgi:hypothetical protein
MRCQMNHNVHALARLLDGSKIPNVAYFQIHAKRFNVLALAKTQIVQHAHAAAVPNQTRYEVDADKAAAARH